MKVHLWLGAALIIWLLLLLTSGVSANINGFSGFAPVNTTAKGVGFNRNRSVLTLTDGKSNEATSVFYPTLQRVTAFRARFTYQARHHGHTGGDGVALVLQKDPRGTKALGANGADLGYGGQTAHINGSSAIALDIYAGGISVLGLNGQTGAYIPTTPVELSSGDPIRVRVVFNGLILHVTLRDTRTGAIFRMRSPFAVENHAAFVGFTGGSGAATAVQRISGFSFISERPLRLAALSLKQLRRMLGMKPFRLERNGRIPLTAYVNPFIGTANTGEEFPGAVAPFGMVQISPDTRVQSMGYYYRDTKIDGFSLLHMSGVGMNDDGDVFFTASTGPVQTRQTKYASPYSHSDESAEPGYYQVRLLKPDVNVKLTATTRAGMVEFAFPADERANVLIPISHTMTVTRTAQVHIVGHRTVEGYVSSQCMGQGPFYKVYFIMRFNRPFWRFGTWTEPQRVEKTRLTKHNHLWHRAIPPLYPQLSVGSRLASQLGIQQPHVGAFVSWAKGNKHIVTAKIGLSYVSIAGARHNLAAEIGSKTFAQVSREDRHAWNKILHRIRVRGGTAVERMIFYTGLYHALLMPSIFSDVDGRYIGFDDHVHRLKPGQIQYANYSGWDIYRDEAPLLALIEPRRMEQMCQSLVRDVRQGGWMPRWPQTNHYTNIMCGSPLTNFITTAWEYGLHNFNMKAAYRAMFQDATDPAPPGKPYGGESGIAYMNKIHYLPMDVGVGGSVSQTEQDCYAYSALARVAQSLDKIADARMLRKRAMFWKNLFDPKTKFMRPRWVNGKWSSPFNPAARPFTPNAHAYVEGPAWEYLWYVPQDEAGLIHRLGLHRYNRRLDTFFKYTSLEWSGRYYNAYNEPDLEVPFLYDYSGQPWKTQRLVLRLIGQVYNVTPAGIPGNDDCGVMSTWVVLSMMGFYPVDPARPVFEMCTPVFQKVTIHLDAPYSARAFVVQAPEASARNRYIQSVMLGGKPWFCPWFGQRAIAHGQTLTVTLGPKPNRQWGHRVADRPPSLVP